MRELYESDITKFMRDLLERNPHLVEEQKKARARWWDKKLNLGEQDARARAEQPREGYYYYDNPKRETAPE